MSTAGETYTGLTTRLQCFWGKNNKPLAKNDEYREYQVDQWKIEHEKEERMREIRRRAAISVLTAEKKRERQRMSGFSGPTETFDKELFSGSGPDCSGGFSGYSPTMRSMDVSSYSSQESRFNSFLARRKICSHKGTGKKHGTKVHSGLETIVELIKTEANLLGPNGVDPELIENHSQEQGKLMLFNNESYESKRINSLIPLLDYIDPCVYAIMDSLITRSIIPIQSEFIIYDELLKIATCIDAIGWDYANNVGLLIELKTGNNEIENYDAHDGRSYISIMSNSVCLKDTALNRAAIQLLYPLIVIAKRYNIDMDGAIVIRTSAGVPKGVPEEYSKAMRNMRTTKSTQIYKIPTCAISDECQNAIYETIKAETISEINESRRKMVNKEVIIDGINSDDLSYRLWNVDVESYNTWFRLITINHQPEIPVSYDPETPPSYHRTPSYDNYRPTVKKNQNKKTVFKTHETPIRKGAFQLIDETPQWIVLPEQTDLPFMLPRPAAPNPVLGNQQQQQQQQEQRKTFVIPPHPNPLAPRIQQNTQRVSHIHEPITMIPQKRFRTPSYLMDLKLTSLPPNVTLHRRRKSAYQIQGYAKRKAQDPMLQILFEPPKKKVCEELPQQAPFQQEPRSLQPGGSQPIYQRILAMQNQMSHLG